MQYKKSFSRENNSCNEQMIVNVNQSPCQMYNVTQFSWSLSTEMLWFPFCFICTWLSIDLFCRSLLCCSWHFWSSWPPCPRRGPAWTSRWRWSYWPGRWPAWASSPSPTPWSAPGPPASASSSTSPSTRSSWGRGSATAGWWWRGCGRSSGRK